VRVELTTMALSPPRSDGQSPSGANETKVVVAVSCTNVFALSFVALACWAGALAFELILRLPIESCDASFCSWIGCGCRLEPHRAATQPRKNRTLHLLIHLYGSVAYNLSQNLSSENCIVGVASRSGRINQSQCSILVLVIGCDGAVNGNGRNVPRKL